MKNKISIFILLQIILVILNAMFFLWKDSDCSIVTWISYASTMIAYAVMEMVFLVPSRDNWHISMLNLVYIAITFFVVELISGIVLSIVTENVTVALMFQLSIMLIFCVWGGVHVLASRNSLQALKEREQNIEYTKIIDKKLRNILLLVNDESASKELKKLQDIIQSSPIKSNSIAREYEKKVVLGIGDLENAVSNKCWDEVISISRNLSIYANSRNNML